MAFPVGPTNGQTTTVNGISYVYNSAKGVWNRTTNQTALTQATINVANLGVTSGLTSTSTTSGALQVLGGAGVTGNINVGGNIYISGTIVPTLTTMLTYQLAL